MTLYLTSQLLNGIVLGKLYALLALGLTSELQKKRLGIQLAGGKEKGRSV